MSPALHWTGLTPNQYLLFVGSLIVLCTYWALRPVLFDKPDLARRHDWAWGIFIFLILSAGRWPSILFFRELDADESFYFAGAHTLFLDPVLFRSVDGTTTGPLNFVALWPASLALDWNNYLAPRLTALVLIGAGLLCAHQIISLLCGRTAARLAGLGALCLESLSNATGFLHYSSELLANTLLAAAGYVAVRHWTDRASLGRVFLGGLLLGAVPFAKPQAAPLALVFGLAWLIAEARRLPAHGSRQTLLLLAGAFLPATAVLLQLSFSGEWEAASISYFKSNVHYTQGGRGVLSDVWSDLLYDSISRDSLLHFWLPGAGISSLLLLQFPCHPDPALRRTLLAASTACLLMLLSIVAPARPYLHYWQLLVLPLTVLTGALTGNYLHHPPSPRPGFRRWRLIMALAIFPLGTILHRTASPNFLLGEFAGLARIRICPPSAALRPFVQPGDSLTVWGWANHLNVETGLPLGTRDAVILQMIVPGPYQQYYRQRYLRDLEQRQPRFFIDAVGPYSNFFEDPRFRHEVQFPALASYIRAHYRLFAEMEGARIYQRNLPAGD